MFSNGLEFSSLVIEIYSEFEFCDLEFIPLLKISSEIRQAGISGCSKKTFE